MTTRRLIGILLCALALAGPAAAGETETVGGDVFVSGPDAAVTGAAARDAFASGFSATLDGEIGGDGHAAGFDVDVGGPIGGDLYAIGATVSVAAPVEEDVTASGFSVRLRPGARVGGNARLTAGSIRVDAPVAGALMAAGGSIVLDAPVEGDVRLTGAEIRFGDDARISGDLVYSAPDPIDIPASVIDAERVRYVELTSGEGLEPLREMMERPDRMFWPSFFSLLGAFVVTLAFLVAVGAVLIAFTPRLVREGLKTALDRPGLSLVAGFLALATLIGLVPVSAMTLIGVPLIPIVILLIVAGWVLAYLLGTYAVAVRLATAFGVAVETNGMRLVVLAAGLVVLAILNFIPFLGWLVNFVIVLAGLGALALMIATRIARRGAAGPQAAPPGASARDDAPEDRTQRTGEPLPSPGNGGPDDTDRPADRT